MEFTTMNNCVAKSRFCYSYKPPGLVEPCCTPMVCATNEHIALIASQPMVVNNSTRTTERSLLLQAQQQFLQGVQSTSNNIVIQNTIQNSSIITSTLYGQLLGIKAQRYEPYRPYVPEFIPSSVIQLQMATANAGVPHSFFTATDCKGVQSVTT
jgi:hypothetical protein